MISMSYLAWICEFMKSYGVGRQRLLLGTGLEDSDPADLAGEMTEAQHLLLIRNAMQLSGDPGLGLAMGFNRHISTLQSYGFAIMCCETYGEAIRVGCEYQGTLGRFSGRFVQLSMRQEGGEAVMDIEIRLGLGEMTIFAVEEMLGSIVASTRWVTGRALPLREIRCAYPPPAYQEVYAKYFSCPVRFNAPHTQVRFDAAFLHTRLPMANASAARVHLEHCKRRAGEADSIQDGLVARVRTQIVGAVVTGLGLDECANSLAISPRTLRRKLQQRGLTYQALVNEVRLGLACSYLEKTDLPVEVIAERVGFKEPTSFSRAFRRSFGCSPRSFRQNR
jgi:AraC-like DNA-binding protein